MYIYIAILFFACLLLFCKKRKYWLPAKYMVSLYLLSLLAALASCFIDETLAKKISFTPTLLFCLLLPFSFSPFFQKEPKMVVDRSSNYNRKFINCGYFISILLIASSLMLVTKMQEAFMYGLVEVRMDMYSGYNPISSYTMVEHIGHSILRWFGGLGYCLLIMFFYALAYIPGYRMFKILLIVSSLSVAYLGMLNGGRTHLLYWVLFFIFSFCVFFNVIPKKEKYWTLLVAIVPIFVLLSLYFVNVSIGRADAAHTETNNMLFDYMGKPYINFCYYYDNIDYHHYTLMRIFPLSNSIIGSNMDLAQYRELIENRTGLYIGTFFTFMGDIYIDIGLIGLLLYIVVVFVVIGNKLCKKKYVTISDILLMGIFARIIVHGLFYYSMYQKETTISLVLTVVLALILAPRSSIYSKFEITKKILP